MTPQNSIHSDVAQQAMQDFVERMQDPMQALEDVRLEDEANCTIGAGYGRITAFQASTADSLLTQTRRQQLRILVMGEFCQMLDDCNLGAGLPDAIRVGQKILSERLKHASDDVQKQLMAALDAALTPDETHDGIPDSARSQVRSVLCSVLSEQDWEAISSAATTAIQLHFKQKIAGAEAA